MPPPPLSLALRDPDTLAIGGKLLGHSLSPDRSFGMALIFRLHTITYRFLATNLLLNNIESEQKAALMKQEGFLRFPSNG